MTNKLLTVMMVYELLIMAMSRLSRTTTLISEYVPNMNRPQKRV